jgi:uncharacterized membrane protein
MAKDVGDMLRDTLNQAVRDAAQSFGDAAQNLGDGGKRGSNGALSGMRGVAAGAVLAALAPVATKGAGKALKRRLAGSAAKKVVGKPAEAVSGATSKVGDTVEKGAGEVKDKVGASGGKAKEAGKRVLPLGGGDGSDGDGDDGDGDGGDGGGGDGGGQVAGVGKGRRMPVQQSCDVAVPVGTAYNQFTQFEEWPNFMHRVTRVTQEDDCTVSFASKIWGVTKEFQADIETQRPDERIKWRVSQGITHTGVVTFHELAPRLTRIELNLDVDPGSLIEKFARGARHVKRAARADLHRFKAFIEMQEQETGAWRGRIEDGELVEEHPEDYDQDREYSEIEEPQAAGQQEEQEQEQGTEEGDKESQRARKQRFERQARASSSGRSRSRSSASGRGDGGPAGGSSKSRSGSSGSRSRSSSGQQRRKPSNRS